MHINLTKSSTKEWYFIIYSYLIISTDQNHKCDPSLQHSKAVNEARGQRCSFFFTGIDDTETQIAIDWQAANGQILKCFD